MRSSLVVFPLTIFVFTSSCGDVWKHRTSGSQDTAAHFLLQNYDSLQLAENDEIYIGNPYSLLVIPSETPGGIREIWVTDFFSNSILQFDGDGEFERRIGGPGPGPHEFSAITLFFLPSPGEVSAVDLRRREIKWFDRVTGELQRFLRYDNGRMGRSPPVHLSGESEQLVFPMLSTVSRASLGILDLDNETWALTGPFPGPYHRSLDQGRGRFITSYPLVFMDQLDAESLVVALSGADTVYQFNLRDRTSTPLGEIPQLRRRGVEGECVFAYETPDHANSLGCAFPDEQFSLLKGLWTLGDERIGVVYADCDAKGRPPARTHSCRGYLTIMDRKEDVACADIRIPGGDDAGTFTYITDDVLYTIDRRVKGDTLETWLLQIPIPEMSACPDDQRVSGWLVDHMRSH